MTARRNQPLPTPEWYGWTRTGVGVHLGSVALHTPREGFQGFIAFCGVGVTEPYPPASAIYGPLGQFDRYCKNCFRPQAWAALRREHDRLQHGAP